MTYRVVVTREGDDWLADVPEVEGAHTWARSLEGLMKSVREVIVLMSDLPDDAEPAISLDFQLDAEVLRNAARVGAERRELSAQKRELQRKAAQALQELLAAHVSGRDAAVLLDMTPGRVSQLANSK